MERSLPKDATFHLIHIPYLFQTEPPPRANFSETVNQWVIFDFYEQYEKMKELEDKPDVNQDEVRNMKPEKKKKIGLNTQEEAYEKDKDVSKRILRSAKVLERMLNLNTFDEIAQDFRFSGIAVFRVLLFSGSGKISRTSSRTLMGVSCLCGSSALRRRRTWRSPLFAGTPSMRRAAGRKSLTNTDNSGTATFLRRVSAAMTSTSRYVQDF